MSNKDLTFLKCTIDKGIRVFNLYALPIEQQILCNVNIRCYGYNNHSPGPIMLAYKGDRIRVNFTNLLEEPSTIHWHGIDVPSNQDGSVEVGQNSQLAFPKDTITYEFTLNQEGTHIYHADYHGMNQMLMGLCGPLIILPNKKEEFDKDYIMFLQEWYIPMAKRTVIPGTYKVNPYMHESNFFTINGRSFPYTHPFIVNYGDKVRVRIINISKTNHPIHIHGHQFKVIATDGNPIPPSCQLTKNTIIVGVGETYDIEFIANNPGIWPFHCHMPHHMTNNMVNGLGGMTLAVKYVK
ncbi:hypothetical protein CCE28_20080 [Anaeromicrobium sediminis]|uniref:Copper oxidase n=1 Tax=Anaeromicrobium sediminis TaxID=1478221 RepID=A0A267MDR1_9FIRM|nr:hypothetical protein CCE28_20080 [Anaeromicrobium sediminis]